MQTKLFPRQRLRALHLQKDLSLWSHRLDWQKSETMLAEVPQELLTEFHWRL